MFWKSTTYMYAALTIPAPPHPVCCHSNASDEGSLTPKLLSARAYVLSESVDSPGSRRGGLVRLHRPRERRGHPLVRGRAVEHVHVLVVLLAAAAQVEGHLAVLADYDSS